MELFPFVVYHTYGFSVLFLFNMYQGISLILWFSEGRPALAVAEAPASRYEEPQCLIKAGYFWREQW